MAEVVASSSSLSVLGGPASVQLSLNSGATGQRGTFIMYGFANPNTQEARETFIAPPQVFDFYVVVDPSSENYLQMYQYVNQDGQLTWIPSIKLAINIYSTTRPVTFIQGVGSTEINLSDLGIAGVSAAGTTQSIDVNFFTQPGSSAYFNVQTSISNFNPAYLLNPTGGASLDLFPVIFTYVLSDVYLDQNDDQLKLPITIAAAEISDVGTRLVDDKTLFVQLLITLQSPEEIIQYISNFIYGGGS
jgi:hypothetical protein